MLLLSLLLLLLFILIILHTTTTTATTTTGHDRSPVELHDRLMRQLYLPSFQAAIDAGVMTAMESYSELGGVPLISNSEYLNDLLRDDMGFDGLLVSDFQEIENLYLFHKVTNSQENAVKMSVQDTSIDMSMIPVDYLFYNTMEDLVGSGEVSEERLDSSVDRIMEVKDKLGL